MSLLLSPILSPALGSSRRAPWAPVLPLLSVHDAKKGCQSFTPVLRMAGIPFCCAHVM